MEKIQFYSGVQSFRINGGEILRFNPADPNIYARFLEAGEKISTLQIIFPQSAFLNARQIFSASGNSGISSPLFMKKFASLTGII